MNAYNFTKLFESDEDVLDALDNSSTLDFEEGQIGRLSFEENKDGYVAPVGNYYLHVKNRDGIVDYGPHEFILTDNDDEVVSFARATKNPEEIRFTMVWVSEDLRGEGIASSIYQYFLDNGLKITSDSEISDGTAYVYRSLMRQGYGSSVVGGRVQLSPKKEPTGLRESSMDQEYFAALVEEDMETAQRMVDEARALNRFTKDLFTAQNQGSLNSFDFNRVGQNEKGLSALGPAIYLLDEKDTTEYVYGKRGPVHHVALSEDAFIIDIFSRDQNHWKEVIGKLDKAAAEIGYSDNASVPDRNVSNLTDGRGPVGRFVKLLGREKTRKLFIKHGIHGSREELHGFFEYGIYDPTKIKSADPVTYDDQGEVIPLSQRFNYSSNDIRY